MRWSNDPNEELNLIDQGLEVQAELDEALKHWILSSHYEGRHHDTIQHEMTDDIEEGLRALGYVE
jgi:hypothetical protein